MSEAEPMTNKITDKEIEAAADAVDNLICPDSEVTELTSRQIAKTAITAFLDVRGERTER